MLLSGLAVLHREARAIFVNKQFYELTIHEADDMNFKSWPRSIQTNDYDWIKGAYK